MGDQEIITLDSDDEDTSSALDGADLVVGPTGTAVPVSQARMLQKLPLPPGMNIRPGPAPPPLPTNRIPKKPGAFPPFALFSQEHRETLMTDNPDITFADVSRTLGEMWHALAEEEKEEYRKRARQIADQKLREWQNKIRAFSQQNSASNITGMPQQRRRRTHGYAIFSSEMRKTIAEGTPMTEMSKIISEAWRNAAIEIRQEYEGKAARANEIEAKRFRLQLMQAQKRLQLQKQQQQLVQQQQQRSIAGPIRQANSGLRISSVSSLSAGRKSQQIATGVNLPSSITISRVEPEISIVAEQSSSSLGLDSVNIPPGLTIQRTRGPPPLMRGGFRGLPIQGRSLVQRVRPPQQQLANIAQRMQAGMQSRQSQNISIPRNFQGLSRLNGTHVVPQKRPQHQNFMSSSPVAKHPRLLNHQQLPLVRSIPVNNGKVFPCRLCNELSQTCSLLTEKPDVVLASKDLLGLDLNFDDDDVKGYSKFVCRKCSSILNTFTNFKFTVQRAQERLRIIKEKKKLQSSSDLSIVASDSDISIAASQPDISITASQPDISIAASQPEESELAILPDLDCEVDVDTQSFAVHKPVSIKQEKISIVNGSKSNEDSMDEARVQTEDQDESKTKSREVKSEMQNQNSEEAVDPLMFIQVGQVQSNFEGFADQVQTCGASGETESQSENPNLLLSNVVSLSKDEGHAGDVDPPPVDDVGNFDADADQNIYEVSGDEVESSTGRDDHNDIQANDNESSDISSHGVENLNENCGGRESEAEHFQDNGEELENEDDIAETGGNSEIGNSENIAASENGNSENLSDAVCDYEDIADEVGNDDDIADEIGNDDDIADEEGNGGNISDEVGNDDDIADGIGSSENIADEVGNDDDIADEVGNDDDISDNEGIADEEGNSEDITDAVSDDENIADEVGNEEDDSNEHEGGEDNDEIYHQDLEEIDENDGENDDVEENVEEEMSENVEQNYDNSDNNIVHENADV